MSSLTKKIDTIFQHIPKKKILLQSSYTLTYGEIYDWSESLSAFIEEIELQTGDRAILCIDDDSCTIPLFLSLIRSGITAIILDPNAPSTELHALITASKSKIFFASPNVLESIDKDEILIGDVVIQEVFRKKIQKSFLKKIKSPIKKNNRAKQHLPDFLQNINTKKTLLKEIPDDTTAYILFTSGTTSIPKGVEISHANLSAQMDTFIRKYHFDNKTHLLNLLPLHHTDGLTQGGVVSFLAGATLYRRWPFSIPIIPKMLDSLISDRITHLVTVPSVLALFMNQDTDYHENFSLKDFQFVISTAAYLDSTLWQSFEKCFKAQIVNVYGLTETVCESLYCGPDKETRKLGTIGKPCDSEARIIDENNKILPSNRIGELQLRGPHIMKGYFGLPDKTNDVLDCNGWFSTGDLAQVDDDGFYTIVGRKKDLIITGGVNVYPEDVSEVLRNIPLVLDAVTFGMPDEIWGEKTVSCVIPKPGEKLKESYIVREFLDCASKQKLPKNIYFLDSFPRGAAGKVSIPKIKKIIIQQQDENSKVNSLNMLEKKNTKEKIISIAAEVFRVPESSLTPHSKPDNVNGWTSLAHVEFLVSIEKDFSLRLKPKDIMRLSSIGSAISIVEEQSNGGC